MNGLSRKLHDIEKHSVIEEPTESRLLIDDEKELQLHYTAQRILENHLKDLGELQKRLRRSMLSHVKRSRRGFGQ